MAQVVTASAVTFNTSVTCRGVTRLRHRPGLRTTRVGGDGQAYPSRLYTQQIAPEIEFSSQDIATLLALGSNTFGIYGIALSAAFSGYLRQLGADGVASNTGDKLAVAQGLVIPVSLTAPWDGIASMDCRVIARSTDGTTNGLSITADQTVPTDAALTSAFCAGRVEVNGSPLSLVQQIAIDFGIDVAVLGGDGLVYPTQVHVTGCRPTIRVTVADGDALNTIGLTGTAQNATDSEIYLRKFDPNGARVADGTAEHIKLSIDDGLVWVEAAETSQGGTGTVDVVFEPVWDATNAILVVSAASAIS